MPDTTTKPEVPAALILAGLVEYWNDGREELTDYDGDDIRFLEECLAAILPIHEKQVRERVAAESWVVPKISHDETVSVGPRIWASGLIRREAGTSDPDHTRYYAAQLLAAADATPTLKEN